jgi:hypothetical protein
METLYRCCGGLDVPKETVEAPVRGMELEGKRWQQMESTGVYGKPIDNILEGRFTI